MKLFRRKRIDRVGVKAAFALMEAYQNGATHYEAWEAANRVIVAEGREPLPNPYVDGITPEDLL